MSYNTNTQTGLSVIELMVAMAVSLLLVTGLVTLVGNTNQNFQELTRASQQLENGRYAWQLLRDEVRLAGFYGELFSVPAPGASLPDPCVINNVASQLSGLPYPVQGYDAPAAAPLSCIPSHLAGTDVLVIRRASTASGTKDGLLHLQSVPDDVTLDTLPEAENEGEDAPALDSVFNLLWKVWKVGDTVNHPDAPGYDAALDITYPPPVRPYFVHIYYISPNSTADDGIPTLKRVEIGAASRTTVALVEGVENMQIVYGIDNAPAPEGDGIPDLSVTDTSTMTTTDWNNVVALELHLLVRNLEATGGYTDTKTYDLGGTTIEAPSDEFKRHVYSASVRLTNPAGRRE